MIRPTESKKVGHHFNQIDANNPKYNYAYKPTESTRLTTTTTKGVSASSTSTTREKNIFCVKNKNSPVKRHHSLLYWGIIEVNSMFKVIDRHVNDDNINKPRSREK